MRKKLGILGGMGSYATQVFFKNILDHTKVNCDQEHLDIIIYNHSSIPDRTTYIMSGKQDELYQILLQDCKELEKMGALNIAIPCNTSHFFADRLQSELNINIINMISETVKYIKENDKESNKIGIMATEGTIFGEVYTKECIKQGLEAVYPSQKMQDKVTNIIYTIKRSIDGSYDDFMEISNELFSKGCSYIILACTELSVFKSMHELSNRYIDALDILTYKCITESGGIYE